MRDDVPGLVAAVVPADVKVTRGWRDRSASGWGALPEDARCGGPRVRHRIAGQYRRKVSARPSRADAEEEEDDELGRRGGSGGGTVVISGGAQSHPEKCSGAEMRSTLMRPGPLGTSSVSRPRTWTTHKGGVLASAAMVSNSVLGLGLGMGAKRERGHGWLHPCAVTVRGPVDENEPCAVIALQQRCDLLGRRRAALQLQPVPDVDYGKTETWWAVMLPAFWARKGAGSSMAGPEARRVQS